MRTALAHTAAPVAAQEGPQAESRLQVRSAALWTAVIAAAGGAGALLSTSSPSALSSSAVPWAAAGGWLLVVLVAPWACRSGPAAAGWLAGWAVSVALLLGAAGMALPGAALVGGLSLVVGEAGATLLQKLRRPGPIAWVTLFVPAAVATAAAYLGSPPWMSAEGAALGAALALALAWLARLGEQVAPRRHGEGQVVAAALTRAVELGRVLGAALLEPEAPEPSAPAGRGRPSPR